MEKLNMTKVKTLFKKGYLLAGVVIATNMFIINEVKASGQVNILDDNEQDANKNFPFIRVLNTASGFILYLENIINLATGLVISGANNYFKWWDYNPGKYSKLGCFGWRSGRLIKDIFQFDINLNLGRGILWLIPGVFGLMQYISKKEDPSKSTAGLIMIKILKNVTENNKTSFGIFYSIFFSLQGFVSMPLAIHISNFSISVSLDSMIWAGIGFFLDKGKKEVYKDGKEPETDNLEN